MSDQSFEPYGDPSSRRQKPPRRGFLTAAGVFCILAVLFFWVFYLSFFFGILAILFAVLSHCKPIAGRRVRRIIVTACLGMLLSGAVTGYALYAVYTTPELQVQLEQIIRYYTGEYGNELFGTEDDAGRSLPESSSESEASSAPRAEDAPLTASDGSAPIAV